MNKLFMYCYNEPINCIDYNGKYTVKIIGKNKTVNRYYYNENWSEMAIRHLEMNTYEWNRKTSLHRKFINKQSDMKFLRFGRLYKGGQILVYKTVYKAYGYTYYSYYHSSYIDHTSNFNGCGWISVYNVLLLLGRYISPPEIINYFETKLAGAIYGGTFGTNPAYIVKYLNNYCKATIGYNKEIDNTLKKSKAGIILYAHNNGAHYIAVQYKNGSFYGYNESGGQTLNMGVSIEKYISNKRYTLISYVSIN